MGKVRLKENIFEISSKLRILAKKQAEKCKGKIIRRD